MYLPLAHLRSIDMDTKYKIFINDLTHSNMHNLRIHECVKSDVAKCYISEVLFITHINIPV